MKRINEKYNEFMSNFFSFKIKKKDIWEWEIITICEKLKRQ